MVVELATTQKALITRGQLVARGIRATTIDEWVAGGRLHALYPGVYSIVVGSLLPLGARELAAVYACGAGAVLSHRPAAEWWELIDGRRGFHLQVTVPDRRIDAPKGIYAHFSQLLRADECQIHNGIPVTSPARTVFDLASQAPTWELARAYEEGLIQGRFSRDSMIRMAMRHKGRRGITKIRALIDRDAPPSVTIREAHRRLLELIRASDLPHPRTEFVIDGRPADIVWEDAKLVVEMDGAAFHNTPSRIERDKLRDSKLAALGYLVVRVTWKELSERPAAVIARIASTYALRLPPPSS